MGRGEQLALAAFALAVALAIGLTPVAARVATRFGMVDRPGGRRLHGRAVPYGGGIALFIAIVAPTLLLAPYVGPQFRAILLGATACLALGILDDRFDLRPALKLAGQIGVAAIPVAAGVRVDHFTLPVIDPISLGALQWPVTIIWIVALMNVVNFIDGMDGLAAGLRRDLLGHVLPAGALARPRHGRACWRRRWRAPASASCATTSIPRASSWAMPARSCSASCSRRWPCRACSRRPPPSRSSSR